MSSIVTASEIRKDFDAWHDRALTEPVRVTRQGRETVVIISAETYHRLKQAMRGQVLAEALTDEEFAALEAAEIPEALRYSIDD